MGKYSASDTSDLGSIRLSIVVSRFNETITSALLDGALNECDRRGVTRDRIDVFYIPGALEIAVVAKECAVRGADAVVCLGAVVKGDTPHFEYVANTAALSIAEVATSTGVPCIFGVLTVENEAQALERIGGAQGHKGEEAAATAIDTIRALREVEAAFSGKSTGFLS